MFNEYFYGLSFMARRLLRLQLPLGHQMNIYTYGWAGTTVNRIGRTRQHITTNAVTEMEECTIELICVYLISNACLHGDYYHYFA